MSQASPVYQGSCLCQGIRYEIKGDIGDIIQCHCQRCRKANGTAFATNAPVKSTDFKITQGTLWDGSYLHELYQEAALPWEWHEELFDFERFFYIVHHVEFFPGKQFHFAFQFIVFAFVENFSHLLVFATHVTIRGGFQINGVA